MIEFHIGWSDGRSTFFYGKRVIGSDFKNRIFVLFSHSLIRKDYVEYLKYHVAEYASCTVWGSGDTKAEALSEARARIRKLKQSGRFLECIKDGCKKQRPFREARNAEMAEIKKYLSSFSKPKPIKNSLKKKVWNASDGKCHYCRVEISESSSWHLEHKQPRTKGGTDEMSNLAVSCARCNLEKGDMTEAEFFGYRKFKNQVAA